MLKNKKLIFVGILIAVIGLIVFNITTETKAKATSEKIGLAWGDKEVYLTFDDAPGDKVTEEILKVLKSNGIKGTFFIVGSRIKGREKILKQINKEGHSMGLHSYTHKFKSIYSNPKVFIDEMLKTSDEIYANIGIRTYILRFPGGSKPFMNKAFLEKLHSNKFKIYDWNVAVSDGINAKLSPDRFYREAINSKKFKSPLIILMHCSGENGNTVKALPKIIDHYKNLGYDFRALTMESPEYYFRVKK